MPHCIFQVSDSEICVMVLDQGLVKQLYVPIFHHVSKRTKCNFRIVSVMATLHNCIYISSFAVYRLWNDLEDYYKLELKSE